MEMHMLTIGWLRKKFFIARNLRSRRQVCRFSHSRAWVANLPMHVDGVRAIHVVNASGREIEPDLVRLADQGKNSAPSWIRRRVRDGDALRCGSELDWRRQI